MFRLCLFLISAVGLQASGDGIRLEHFEYPFPEKVYKFHSQAQEMEMVYMDVAPEDKVRGTVVLLHGKNFSGAYFETTARALADAGFRVIMPDQVGFGKSTKPSYYQYSLHQLAANTRDLLASVGVDSAHVLGHSMGGMVATRLALMEPEFVQSLTLLNPIGLEDWKAEGVPYQAIDAWYRAELGKTPEKIRAYQRESYYDGEWSPAFDPWVEMLGEFIKSEAYPRMAWNQALTYDMIFTQPVVYEFPDLEVPTLLIIGQRDRTALGKDRVSADKRAELGDYPELGRAARAAIPDAKLVELDDVGHLPHIEAFDRFIRPYTNFLQQQTADGEGP